MAVVASGFRSVSVVGTGSYLPERILTNADMEKIVDTSDEWITTRTGIKTRHIASDNQASSDLGSEAAKRALDSARIEPSEIDMIIVASVTPDMAFPSTACIIQKTLGASNAACFDLSAACCGFLFSLETARQFIASGTINTALVIAAEKLSCITDWKERSTCVLFGDGAGAAVLQSRPGRRGLITSVMESDGNLGHLLMMPGGGSRHPASEQTIKDRLHFIKMAGPEVFKCAVSSMLNAAQKALKRGGMTIDQVNCVIPHQANKRIVQAVGSRLGAPIEKYFLNMDRCGNMSAASVAVALDEAVRSGFVKDRDIVLMMAFGGGFTSAATILEWNNDNK